MGLHFFFLVWVSILIIISMSMIVNSQVEGCSLVGVDLQQCFIPTDNSAQFSIDYCCNSLNIVVKAGYYCLCSLLGPSMYPFFDARLALSFSDCNISLPSLTHCQVVEPEPVILSPPPAATLPPPTRLPPPATVVLQPIFEMPPSQPRPGNDQFVHLPPKVEESPADTRAGEENSSIGDRVSDEPKVTIPERYDLIKSDGGNHFKVLKNLLLLLVACIIVIT